MKKNYEAIEKFHKRFELKGTNNAEMTSRLNPMIEELDELSQAITKGKIRDDVIKENIDLLNLVI